MLKRIVVTAILALGVFAAGSTAVNPWPECHPCPWVR